MNELITLVIADDHPLFRKGLREAIESDPTLKIVGEASDGAAVLELIQLHTPDIAILDIDMPKMGGLTVAREIQQRKIEIDVIFLTMYEEEDLFNEAMDAGGRGYVLKDSAVIDILNAIHAVAGGKFYISPDVSDHLIKRTSLAKKFLQHAPLLEDLTPTELRVLKLIAGNRTSKDIAEVLSISYKTVENHRTSIAEKLDLHGSHSLLKFALENKDALSAI